MIAVKKEVPSVVDTAGGKVDGLEEHEGRIAHNWVKLTTKVARTSLQLYFWHSSGWTARNEALMEAVISTQWTRHTRG